MPAGDARSLAKYPWVDESVSALLFAVLTVSLALNARAASEPLIVLAVAGTAGALLVRRFVRTSGRELALLVTLLVVAGTSVLATPTLVSEALAGGSALAAVVWVASDPSAPRSFGFRWSGALLPGLAVAVAVVVSGLLPGTQELLGVAAALLLVVVFWVTYVLVRPDPFQVAGADGGESS